MQQQERVWAAFSVQKTKFGGWDNFVLAFTDFRCIVAKVSGAMVTQYSKQVAAESKAAGKGWLERMADTMTSGYDFWKRYIAMSPDQILTETPGNFFVPYQDIRKMEFYQRANRDARNKSAITTYVYEMKMEARTLNATYVLPQWPGEQVGTLKQMFGERVKA